MGSLKGLDIPVAAVDLCRRANRRALTRMEVLVVLGVIVIAVAILVPALRSARSSSQTLRCISNLRQIQQAFINYAADNSRFPAPALTGVSWERSLLPYLGGTSIFQCPNDEEVFPVFGSSYDWRDTGRA